MSPGCALLQHQKGWTTLPRGGVARPQESLQRSESPHRILVSTALLDECEGLLRSPCGHLMSRSVIGIRHQHCLMATLVVGLRRQKFPMEMPLFVECEGLHRPCHISSDRGPHRILVSMALLDKCGPLACYLGKSVRCSGLAATAFRSRLCLQYSANHS